MQYVKCCTKYSLNNAQKYSILYDSENFVLSSFHRKVYSQHINGLKCIDESIGPAASYRGRVSWYTSLNIIGCNITEVTLVFEIKNDCNELSNVQDFITLDY